MSDSAQPPLYTVRTGAQGEPTLVVSTTGIYVWLYSDRHSGASMDVTIYRPAPSAADAFIIGDYAQGNYQGPTGISFTVRAVNDDPSNPLLKPPSDYTEVWNDHGSGGSYDGSIWSPIPPDGYIAIGCVCQGGYDKPAIPSYRCLRKDLVEKSEAGNLIWRDKGSFASKDVSLYAIVGVPNSFAAQANYNPYTGPAWQIKGAGAALKSGRASGAFA